MTTCFNTCGAWSGILFKDVYFNVYWFVTEIQLKWNLVKYSVLSKMATILFRFPMVRFLNGWDSYSYCYDWPLQNRTIGNQNFKTFGIPKCSIFQCSVFKPPLYWTCSVFGSPLYTQITFCQVLPDLRSWPESAWLCL